MTPNDTELDALRIAQEAARVVIDAAMVTWEAASQRCAETLRWDHDLELACHEAKLAYGAAVDAWDRACKVYNDALATAVRGAVRHYHGALTQAGPLFGVTA